MAVLWGASRVVASTVDGSIRLTIDGAGGGTARDRESEVIATIRMSASQYQKPRQSHFGPFEVSRMLPARLRDVL